MSAWNILEKKLNEGPIDPSLNELVPGKTSQELENLYLVLSWVGGFLGGHLPDARLKEIYWRLEGLASPAVTSKKHDWGQAGRRAGTNKGGTK